MSYSVTFASAAAKDIRALSEEIRRRVGRAINGLEHNPRPAGARKLSAEEDTYRVRVGDYRVVYVIEDRARSVLVARIRHRRDVYR
jgi:mRNA interferase RelE/StbE